MTGPDFIAWQERQGLTIQQVQTLFDTGRRTITRYRAEGAPRVVELACRWLEANPSHSRTEHLQPIGE